MRKQHIPTCSIANYEIVVLLINLFDTFNYKPGYEGALATIVVIITARMIPRFPQREA